MVFLNDLSGDVAEFEAEVLRMWERGHEVEFGDVQGHELGLSGGDDAVKQKFGCEHFGGGGCHFAGVIDAITAYGEASAVGFSFLRAYGADEAPVCDVFGRVMGNVCFADESDGVTSPDAAQDPLSKATEIVGGGDGPIALVDGVA